MNATDLNRGAVRPIECFRAGWQLIKDDYWLFFGICAVGSLIAHAMPPPPGVLLMGPMLCGIEICLLRRLDRRPIEFSTLFEGFNFFGPGALAAFIVYLLTVLATGVIVAIYIAAIFGLVVPQAQQIQPGAPPDPEFFATFGGIILLYTVGLTAVSIAAVAPSIFMYSLIVDRELPGHAAFAIALKALLLNFWGVLGLLLISFVLNFAGAMACLVGLFFVLPINNAAFAVAYRQVFPRLIRYEELLDEGEEPAVEQRPAVAADPSETGIQAELPRGSSASTEIEARPPGE
jgi:hypothetical protein